MKISILDAAKIAYEVKRALNNEQAALAIDNELVNTVPFEEASTEVRETAIDAIHQYLQTAGASPLDVVTKAVVDASR